MWPEFHSSIWYSGQFLKLKLEADIITKCNGKNQRLYLQGPLTRIGMLEAEVILTVECLHWKKKA
jgi:hypothetical protein